MVDKDDAKIVGRGLVYGVALLLLVVWTMFVLGLGWRIFSLVAFG